MIKNEPNSNPFSPATTWRGCLAPTPAVDYFYLIAVAITKNCQTNPISPQINVTSVMTNYYINEQRTMPALSRVEGNNEQLSNEPNLCKTNPILPAILSIYAIACALGGKYLGVLCALGGFKQKMQNEPNEKLYKLEKCYVLLMLNAKNAVFRRKMLLKVLYPIKPAGYNKNLAGFLIKRPRHIMSSLSFYKKLFLAES